MIVLFTDFGLEGPYVGQMKAVLYRDAPGVAVIDLFSDAPPHRARAAAYLLAAYAPEFPLDAVFLAVVDPGVGSKERRAVVVRADGRWYVGPDNGLLNVVSMRARAVCWWEVTWRPARLSASFHGRDLFAPVAAQLASGKSPPGTPVESPAGMSEDWPEDLAEVVYVDHFGNAMTGLRASGVAPDSVLHAGDHALRAARTFSDVSPGEAFWYENANGLVEIAVNQGRADAQLGIAPGDAIHIAAGDKA